jgi:hypothetical protein
MDEPSQQRERAAGQTDTGVSEFSSDSTDDTPTPDEAEEEPRWGGFELVFLSPFAFFWALGIFSLISTLKAPLAVLGGNAAVVAAAILLAVRSRGMVAGFALLLALFLGAFPLLIGACVLALSTAMRSG